MVETPFHIASVTEQVGTHSWHYNSLKREISFAATFIDNGSLNSTRGNTLKNMLTSCDDGVWNI